MEDHAPREVRGGMGRRGRGITKDKQSKAKHSKTELHLMNSKVMAPFSYLKYVNDSSSERKGKRRLGKLSQMRKIFVI